MYDLQESDSDTSDDDKSWDSDSDESRAQGCSRNSKKRMSILTGRCVDPTPVYDSGQAPGYEQQATVSHVYPYGYNGYSYGFSEFDMHGAMYAQNTKRRFFHSGARWDETFEHSVAKRYGAGPLPRPVGVVGHMTGRGGRKVADDDMEEDEW